MCSLRFFLGDDTVDITEVRAPNDGRDRNSALWKRSRLPRIFMVHDSRSRDIEAEKGDADYYDVNDFRVGAVIQVLGRNLELYDADPKTHDWCVEHRAVPHAKRAVLFMRIFRCLLRVQGVGQCGH